MLEISINEKELQAIVDKLSRLSLDDSGKALSTAFTEAALFVEDALKNNISGSILKVRSGRLRSSIGSLVTPQEGGLRAEIGSGVRQGERMPYANIHETGGVITPKRKQFLTIPLDAAKTAAGVLRFTAQNVMQGATKYTSSFIRKGIIFGVTGKKGKVVPLFVLKTSVNIPARYWMSKTVDETSQAVVDVMINKISEVMNA